MQILQVLVIFYWNPGTLALFHGQFTRLFVWYVNRQADKAGPKKVDEVIRSRGFFSFFLQAVARLQIGPAAKAAHYSQICSAQCTWDWELLKKWLGQQAESRLRTWWSQYWGRSTSRRRDSALSTTTSCGGSIELSGPQQRWSAVSRNTVSLTQWKTQKMGSLFELILNF